MIPIFWRYLLKGYSKTFILCVLGFISLLLVMRLKEIARFAALASSPWSVAEFVLTQIPSILPLAIPISCLIASILLFQGLSRRSEMTALRSSGLSLKTIAFPILLFSLLISFVDLYIGSEAAPSCRIKARNIMKKQSSSNPILLLERQNLLKIHHSFVDIEEKENDLLAKDILFIAFNNVHNRLNLFHIKELELVDDLLVGKNVAIISHVPSKEFDTLVIENQELMTTKAEVFSRMMKSQHWNLNANQLTLPMLLIKSKESCQKGKQESPLSEIVRRISLALSSFSLTFIGLTFGLEISRLHSKKGILMASLLSLFVLSSFFIGKEFRFHPVWAILIYAAPQPLILLLATRTLRKISRGLE